ncbi:MAG: hypothetical protein Tsb009_31300 [Planctomycetaceae bacterium]
MANFQKANSRNMNNWCQRFVMGLIVLLIVSQDSSVQAEKPVAARKPNLLRTYRFTAKIIHNGGVTPFKVGTKLTGEFTYDLAAPNTSKLKWLGFYRSSRTRFAIRYGKLVFSSEGNGWVNVAVRRQQEGMVIEGTSLKLPKGWVAKADLAGKSKTSCGISLQNQRSRQILSNTNLPTDLTFWKRFEYCTVSLDFASGTQFPGGSFEKYTRVIAQVEKLDLKRQKNAEPKKLR